MARSAAKDREGVCCEAHTIRTVEDETITQCPIDDRCMVCGGALIERRLKKHCTVCGVLCETCCDNGVSL